MPAYISCKEWERVEVLVPPCHLTGNRAATCGRTQFAPTDSLQLFIALFFVVYLESTRLNDDEVYRRGELRGGERGATAERSEVGEQTMLATRGQQPHERFRAAK